LNNKHRTSVIGAGM